MEPEATMQRIFASQATLHKLEIFCMVCQMQSVTRVAERMGVAQPVVTAHLRFLEDKLGVRLFVRQGRRIALTEAGERVLKWANEVVTRTRELERELSAATDTAVGSVVVAASMTVASYVLPRLFARFRETNPHGEIALQISNPRAVTDSVREGSCDFALCILDPRHDVDGLNVERIWEEQLVLVAAPDSTLIGDAADIRTLADLPFITSPRNQVRRELEDDALRAYGIVRNRIVLEFGHPEAMKQAVRNHAGVAFVLETSVRDELKRGLLRKVETPDLNLPVPMFLVHRRGKTFSALQARLLNFVRDAAIDGIPA
jgi:DNA-binding transcriptional LysR family regulator